MTDELAQNSPETAAETPRTLAELLKQRGIPADPSTARVLLVGPDPNYYRALGQFIEAYATCEGVIFSVLTFYAGVSIPVAKALFARTRMEGAVNYISRIAEALSMAPERRADLRKIFSQLKLITEMRNRLIHSGSFVTTDKGRVTTTARIALTAEQLQEHRASIEVLEAMSADVVRIYNALLWDMNPNRPSLSDPSLTEPWQYKPEPST
jgi:hypothetical protein